MSKAIIFKNEDGGVSIIGPISNYPHLNTLNLTVEQIAGKDVPAGSKYAIIDKSEVPTDRTFRGAWFVEESELTDGVGLSEDDKATLMLEVTYEHSVKLTMTEITNHANSTKEKIAELMNMYSDENVSKNDTLLAMQNYLAELNQGA